jgi:hypothetical protein
MGIGTIITAVISLVIAEQAPNAVGQDANHSDMQHSMPGMNDSMMSSMERNLAGAMQPEMSGFFGPYSMSREASGTSWQPEATPMQGIHFMADDWMLMFHGFAFGVYDNHGAREEIESFSARTC